MLKSQDSLERNKRGNDIGMWSPCSCFNSTFGSECLRYLYCSKLGQFGRTYLVICFDMSRHLLAVKAYLNKPVLVSEYL